jgi:hypothetical protein
MKLESAQRLNRHETQLILLQQLRALIQLQNYPAVGEYCKRVSPSAASLLSPLHAACVCDMLCPAIDAAASPPGDEVALVPLLEWLRGCAAPLQPEHHHLQPPVVKEILLKAQRWDSVLLPAETMYVGFQPLHALSGAGLTLPPSPRWRVGSVSRVSRELNRQPNGPIVQSCRSL